MSGADYHELFPLGADDAPYRKLTGDYVSTGTFEGSRLVKVAPDAGVRRGALALLDNARALLVKEFDTKERQERLRCLEQFLPGADNEMTYAEAAGKLGVPEGTVKSDVHRLKVRYRKFLRDEIGRTVSQPSEIDEELRHLMNVLARASG